MPVLVREDIIPNLASFNRHLRAENLSPKTLETYAEPVNQLAVYLEAQGMPMEVAHIARRITFGSQRLELLVKENTYSP